MFSPVLTYYFFGSDCDNSVPSCTIWRTRTAVGKMPAERILQRLKSVKILKEPPLSYHRFQGKASLITSIRGFSEEITCYGEGSILTVIRTHDGPQEPGISLCSPCLVLVTVLLYIGMLSRNNKPLCFLLRTENGNKMS